MLWGKKTQKAIQIAFAVIGVFLIVSLIAAYMPGILY